MEGEKLQKAISNGVALVSDAVETGKLLSDGDVSVGDVVKTVAVATEVTKFLIENINDIFSPEELEVIVEGSTKGSLEL